MCARQVVGAIEIVGCKFVDNFAFGEDLNDGKGTHLYLAGATNAGGENAVAIYDTTFDEENMTKTWDAIEKSPDDIMKQSPGQRTEVPSKFKPSGGFIPGAIHVFKADVLLVKVIVNLPYTWLFQQPTDSGSSIEIVNASITRSAVDSSACACLRK